MSTATKVAVFIYSHTYTPGMLDDLNAGSQQCRQFHRNLSTKGGFNLGVSLQKGRVHILKNT